VSLYKQGKFYYFDFIVEGHRVSRSTRKTTLKEAKQVEAAEREAAREQVKAQQHAAVSLKIDHVAERYWEAVGQHHAGADTTERDLERLVIYFGKDRLITDIADADVTKLVAWRRGHRIKGDGDAPLIAPATVNRSTTEVLKKLFTFLKRREGIQFKREPDWKQHRLTEPEERIRELQQGEADAIDAEMRDDFAPLFAFVAASGLRQREAVLLRWSEIDFGARRITKTGKGGKRLSVQIMPSIREIIWPLQGHHPEFVFTYVAARTSKRAGVIKGQRYPMTLSGVKTYWRRLRAEAGVEGFRFHDYRHDFATKLLRETGNLKLVQRALNHRNIKTTMRYAHVLDDEVAEAMEAVARKRAEGSQESPQGQGRKAG
jgi:integrase